MENSGHGKSLRMLGLGLQEKGHTIYYMPLNYCLAQIVWGQCYILNTGHHPQIQRGEDDLFLKRIADYLVQLSRGSGPVDYVILHGDKYWMNKYFLGDLTFPNSKCIFYTTPDSDGFQEEDKEFKKNHMDLFDSSDKIIVTSNFGKDQVKKYFDWDVDVIHHAIETKTYFPVNEHVRAELRKFHKLKAEHFVIFAGGRASERKRHDLCLEACAKLINEFNDVRLVMNVVPRSPNGSYGKIDPKQYCKTVLKKKYGRDFIKEERIIFIGEGYLGYSNIDEKSMRELYQMSDVWVSTSGGEGFGLMTAEAMATGLPVVVPNNTTMPEVVGGKAGILTECKKEHKKEGFFQEIPIWEDTYEALKKLYQSKKTREDMGVAGRERALEMFSPEKFIQSWHDLIIKGVKKRRQIIIKEGEPNDGNKDEQTGNKERKPENKPKAS